MGVHFFSWLQYKIMKGENGVALNKVKCRPEYEELRRCCFHQSFSDLLGEKNSVE